MKNRTTERYGCQMRDRKQVMEQLKNVTQYEIVEAREVADLNSWGCVLRHKKTGARIALLSNDDNNKVFYIGFRTPPADSTGVAHIIEHTVLCGSQHFPVKDPFIELAKGSLNTFLNAMTYPDKTVYPVASCNDTDFQNLMHVYLDAVFYPNIYKEEKIFMQEGWHYELQSKEDMLTINGVVYNEMKGAFSSPDDVLDREIFNSLFPDTAYGTESGGDPDVIPDLTYENFLEFHKKYYHPSNSYIYLYGDMDMEEKLRFLDKEYLSCFDALSIDSEIKLQEPFQEPVSVAKSYSIMDGEEESESTYLAYSTMLSDNTDKLQYLAFEILDYVLCSAPGAPLKEALTDAGIGKEIYSVYESGIRQPYFSIVSKNTEQSKLPEFIELIETVLNNQVKNGLDEKALLAGINYFEFKYREQDFGSHPKGLILGLQALDSWLYDDSKPFWHIEANETFAALKKEVGTGYYEGLIEKYLINNTHKSIVTVTPEKGMTIKKDAALQKKLKDYKASLTPAQIEEIVEKTAALIKYQEELSSKEDLEKIPLLKRADMKKEAEPFINEERYEGDTLILFHNIFTNGIGYLRFVFDIGKIPARLFPYVGLLKNVLGMVDTDTYKYGDLFHEINSKTGGIIVSANTYSNANKLEECKITFEVKAKALAENLGEVFRLVKEMLVHSKFNDYKRIYDIIAETKSRMQAHMTSAGHSVAAIRALSYISKPSAIAEQISGIPQYRLLEQLELSYEDCKEEVAKNLTELVSCIFRKENLMLDYTATQKEYEGVEPLLKELKQSLFESKEEEAPFRPELVKKNEGLKTSAQVQFVCRAGNFISKGLPYTGALRVLKVMLGYDYLWNRVRVKGGAYGCMCNFGKLGDSYFVSYRDPNLKNTLEVYESAADYIKNFEADERTITQFIIGAISELDVPMTPASKGAYSMTGYLTNLGYERVQKEREELLAVTEETIRGLSAYINAFMEDECMCVVGGEEKIKENEELFMITEPLFR